MIIKQTDAELIIENGRPTEFKIRGYKRPIEEAVELYGLDKPHYMDGAICGEPFTDINAIAAAKELEQFDKEHFKLVEIIDTPSFEWAEGRVY